jgi:hypothetical protein
MARNKELELDEKRSYAVVRGHDDARYLQDGRYFDVFKKHCGDAPAAFTPKKAPPPAPKRQNAREKALARAAEKLGDLGKGGPPKTVADAARENAAAAAAEDNAE